MINYKAINILKGLTKKELIRFEKFLLSPFYNNNKNLLLLYKYLKKFYPEFDSSSFTKKNIHAHVFGKTKFSDEKLRKLFSDFYKLGEKFLVALNLEKNKFDYDRYLLDELDWRKIDNIFLSKFKDKEKQYEKSDYHYQTFFYQYILKWQTVSFHLDRGEQFKIPKDVFERTEQLIFYFLSDLFISLNDIDVNKNTFNYNPSVNLPEKFLELLDLDSLYQYIGQNNFKNKELFSMYYYLYLMNKNRTDESYFLKLKDLLEKNFDRLSINSRMHFILRMISICNRYINLNKSIKFQSIKLELYDMILKHKLYKTNQNYFRSDLFLNLFMEYISFKSSYEAELFFKENIRSINPAHIKKLQSLCNAVILFEEGKFSESLEICSIINSNLMTVKIILRKLILKIFYELMDYDGNKDEIRNFRQFISNSKLLNETHKNSLQNFLKLFNDLVNLKYDSKDEFLKYTLKSNAENIIDISDRVWFNKKLKEIK